MLKSNLQMFGGRGASSGAGKAGGNKGGAEKDQTPLEALVGKTVDDLKSYTEIGGYRKLREDFGLNEATEKQVDAIHQIVRGMYEYDRTYGTDKEPFGIDSISITRIIPPKTTEEKAQEKEIFGRSFKEDKTLHVTIRTSPKTDNAYINAVDAKYRSFLIGNNGGIYTYNNNGKKKSIKPFDAAFGKSNY